MGKIRTKGKVRVTVNPSATNGTPPRPRARDAVGGTPVAAAGLTSGSTLADSDDVGVPAGGDVTASPETAGGGAVDPAVDPAVPVVADTPTDWIDPCPGSNSQKSSTIPTGGKTIQPARSTGSRTARTRSRARGSAGSADTSRDA